MVLAVFSSSVIWSASLTSALPRFWMRAQSKSPGAPSARNTMPSGEPRKLFRRGTVAKQLDRHLHHGFRDIAILREILQIVHHQMGNQRESQIDRRLGVH